MQCCVYTSPTSLTLCFPFNCVKPFNESRLEMLFQEFVAALDAKQKDLVLTKLLGLGR